MRVPLQFVCLVLCLIFSSQSVRAAERLDPGRVEQIGAMLAEKPAGVGRPISDREFWSQLAQLDSFKRTIAESEKIIAQPIPEQPDELYLEYSRNGNRTHWQNVAFRRRGFLTTLTLAECVENKGRFIPRLQELIAALCAERTWVMPAHDGRLENFNGKTVYIDLASSALGWELATADWLLGDKLGAGTRTLIRDNVARRILQPFRAAFTGQSRLFNWMSITNNWNAVCLAGVTGAALEQLESRTERAQFIAAAEKYTGNFLAGFTPDGYCSEGLGYWNYGFGHYVLLTQTIREATVGKLDLLARPEAKMPAQFGLRIQIVGGVSPAFADCPINAKPSRSIMYYLNRRFGFGLSDLDASDPRGVTGTLFDTLIYSRAKDELPAPTADVAAASAASGLRTWFENAGILIARPARGSSCRMGVALKGGHNAEHHNHNDVGSYVVVLSERPVLLDPGAETYTARTFSARRYDSKLLNSFGHPVPVVAGQLQQPGAQARAKVLETTFTDATETLRMDIASAYAVPDLKTLERTFVYSRQGAGSLSVSDHVEFKNPQSFGTALITLGTWRKLGDRMLLIKDGGQGLQVEIDTGGLAFDLKAEEIREDAPVQPTRIGINLSQPTAAATISLRITPAER